LGLQRLWKLLAVATVNTIWFIKQREDEVDTENVFGGFQKRKHVVVITVFFCNRLIGCALLYNNVVSIANITHTATNESETKS
jgi:hypothetical protein